MTKLRTWRCFLVVMVLVLSLGVCAMAVPTSPALAAAPAGAWDIQTVDEGNVWATSLALDSNGYPHISYTTVGDGSLHYARWMGTAWAKETVDECPAFDSSLALDSNGYPHISYTTVGDGSLHYARWTGTAWAKETVDTVDAMFTSIALDSSDYPHISYATGGFGSLHYAHWMGTVWAKETVDECDAWDCAIALDSNGYPHISYTTVGDGSLHYARWTGTVWAKETVDTVDAVFTSIALDSSDYPHISYTTGGFGSLHYARWMGTVWAKETVDECDAWDCAIALDSNGYPHISYTTVGDGSLHYARWTGTVWAKETVDTVEAMFTSIALDSSDYPHISYATGGFDSLHYARLIPPPAATVNTATGTGTATFSTSAGGIAMLTAIAPAEITCVAFGVAFPHGFFSFNILGLDPGETVTVTITLPLPMPAGAQYWKCQNGTWIDCTSLLGDNDGDNVLTLTLTDGGLGDADGIANGTIIDPGGPAIPVTAVHPNSGVQGQTLDTTITGINFTGATVVSFGAGITVNSFTIDSATQITANITIAGNADIGARNVSVTTPGGTGTLTGGFTVNPAPASTKPQASPSMMQPPRVLSPAQLSAQYVSVSPQQMTAGQPVTITTNVVNTGDEAGNINVALKINGQLEQSRMVSVGPHGTQPVKFTVTKTQPGTYNVDILGKSGSFTILGAGGASGTTGSKTGGMIVLALIGILIVASVVVLLVRRT